MIVRSAGLFSSISAAGYLIFGVPVRPHSRTNGVRGLTAHVFFEQGVFEAEVDRRDADHQVMDMSRKDIINVTRIAGVMRAFQDAPHNWRDRIAWRMFTAANLAKAIMPEDQVNLFDLGDIGYARAEAKQAKIRGPLSHDVLSQRIAFYHPD